MWDNLCLEYYFGKINISDIVKLRKLMVNDINYFPNIPLLVDYRKSELTFEKHQVVEYVNFLKKNIKATGYRKTAVIIDTVKKSEIEIFKTILDYDLPMKIKIFDSIESSINYLSLTQERFTDLIKQTEMFNKSAQSRLNVFSRLMI
jgi:hypothetical protein